MRSILLELPKDPVAPHLDKQYMLGDSLLVVPVFHESDVTFYLPAGQWTDLWTGEEHIGPTHITEICLLDRVPVFVKEGSVLVLGPPDVTTPDYVMIMPR